MLRPTRHLYLDLPALTPELQAYITHSSQAGGWSSNCVQVPAPSADVYGLTSPIDNVHLPL